MRLPVQELPRVEARPQGTPYSKVDPGFSEGGAAIAQGLNQVGKAFGQAGHAAGEYLATEQKKNDTKAARDQLTGLESDYTNDLHGNPNPTSQQAGDAAFDERDPKEGFLSLKGETAVDKSAPTLDRFEEMRAKRRESLQNEEQRKLYDQESERVYQRARGDVVTHASRQREQARLDTIKAAEDEAVRSAALNPEDDKRARELIAGVVGPMDNIVTSPRDAFNKADAVQARVTEARLEMLLAKPGGFTDADRVYQQNKAVLGLKADDYARRIEAAKVGGLAAVEADRIVVQSQQANQDRAFAIPAADVADREIAKLPPDMQAKVSPIVHSRIAMLKAARAEERDQFVNKAVSVYNVNPGTFFQSDLARQLNQVDPDKYRSLKNEMLTRARLWGDNSAAARREQAELNKVAWQEYMKRPLDERVRLNVGSEFAGSGADKVGLGAIGVQQTKDKAAMEKSGAVNASSFTTSATADADGFLPAVGTTPKSKAAAKSARDDFKARAEREYVDFVVKNERPPTSSEAADLRAKLVLDLPVNPKNKGTLQRNVDAVIRLNNKAAGGTKPTKRDRAVQLKGKGLTNQQIADQLNTEGY